MTRDLAPTVIEAARHVVAAWTRISCITDPERRKAMMALRIAVNAHKAQQKAPR